MKEWVKVCEINDVTSESFLICEINGVSAGIIRYEGQLKSYLNVCPHAGAPVCKGFIEDTLISKERYKSVIESENSILICPWHGFEFRIEDGSAMIKESKNLVSISVREDESSIFLYL